MTETTDTLAADAAPNSGKIRASWIGWAVVGIVVAVLAMVFPDDARHAVVFTVENLLYMAPILAVSVLITAGVHATGLSSVIGRAFRRNMGMAILIASVVGALTPICGVGVLPIIAGFLSAGVPLAPIMAFWLSSPITSPTMFAITLGTLGMSFAVGKTVLAFALGLFGGAVCWAVARTGLFDNTLKTEKLPTCCGSDALVWAFWREPARRTSFYTQGKDAALLILKWLTIAFAIESVIRTHLPPEMVANLVGTDSVFAVELGVLVGAPIYLDGYASLPLVRGLVELGMTPGAAMAFMISGGAISLYASVAVFALVRLPVFAAYIGCAVVGAWAAGHLYGWAVGVF